MTKNEIIHKKTVLETLAALYLNSKMKHVRELWIDFATPKPHKNSNNQDYGKNSFA